MQNSRLCKSDFVSASKLLGRLKLPNELIMKVVLFQANEKEIKKIKIISQN